MKGLFPFLFLFLPVLANPSPTPSPWKDVSPESPEWQALQALDQMGVVFGYPDGLFRGDRAATRREMVLALYRLWLKAVERQDALLKEAVESLTRNFVSLAEAQAALERRLSDSLGVLEGRVPDEETLKELLALRPNLLTLEEAVSRLSESYLKFEGLLQSFEERLNGVDQRTLAWSEDSVNLQRSLKALERELKENLEELRRSLASLEERTRTSFSELARQEETGRGEVLREVERRLEPVAALSRSVEELSARLNATREELFRLAESLKTTEERLTEAFRKATEVPPPLYLGLSVTGTNPLRLLATLGYEDLGGLALRVGAEWASGNWAFQGALAFPLYRGRARGQMGFGLHHDLTYPYLLLFAGIGTQVLPSLELYGEGQGLWRLDGGGSAARIGLGLRFRP